MNKGDLIDDVQNLAILCSATEMYFRAKSLMMDDLPKPIDWIYYPGDTQQKWEQKKAELIQAGNYDSKTPLVIYMEIMMKWINNHHLIKPTHSNSL